MRFAAPETSQPTWLQGYLAHKKLPPRRTLQQDYTWGPMVVLGEGKVSYERGIPVQGHLAHKKPHSSLGPPYGPTHRPIAGSWEGVFFYERGPPVGLDAQSEVLLVRYPCRVRSEVVPLTCDCLLSMSPPHSGQHKKGYFYRIWTTFPLPYPSGKNLQVCITYKKTHPP